MSDNLRPAPGFDDEAPGTFQADQSDLYRKGYSTPTEEDTKTRWGDYGRAFGVGTIGVASAIPTLAEYATQGEVGGDTRRYLEGKSEGLEAGMTPVAKRSMNAAILPTEGQESITDVGVGSSLGLQGMAALPSVIASIIPGGLAARMARTASVARQAAIAGGVARGSAAVLGGADVTQQIFSTIDDMSDKELYDASPAFKGYIDAGLSSKEARGRFNTDVAGVTPFLAGGISALLATPEAEMAANVAGVGVKKGLLKGALHGAIGEAKEEAVESGTNEFMAEQKLAEQNLGDRDWYNVLSKTVQGATIGAAVGGGTGGVTNIGGVAPDQKLALDQQAGAKPAAETVPEQPETMAMQQSALVSGQRPAMLFPEGTKELSLPEGIDRIETPVGVVHFRPELIDQDKVLELATPERVNELLGYLQSKDQAVQQGAAQGEEPVAAVTRKGGKEVDAALVSPDKADEQLDILAQRAPAGSTQSIERPGDVVRDRMSAPIAPDALAAMQASAPPKPGVGPAGQAVINQRQAPAPNILPGWEDEDMGDAGLNRAVAEPDPDLVRYDDGTTQAVAQPELRVPDQPPPFKPGRPTGWMTPATERAIKQAEANRAARNQTTAPEEPSSSVQTEVAAPKISAAYNPETKRLQLGDYQLGFNSQHAMDVFSPDGTSVNIHDRANSRHAGRRDEMYADEMSARGIPEPIQRIVNAHLAGEITPEQIVNYFANQQPSEQPSEQPSSSVQTDATSEVTPPAAGAIKPKRTRRTKEEIDAANAAKAEEKAQREADRADKKAAAEAAKQEAKAQREAARTEKANRAIEAAKKRAADKAAGPKAPTKTKSKNAVTTTATTEPATEATPSGVIRPVYVRVAERLTNKTRVSAEGSHEAKSKQEARKAYAKAAEEAFYAHQPGDDEVYEGAQQIDLLRPKDSMTGSRFVRSDKQRKAIRARIEKFIGAIEGAGHEIPSNVTKNSNNFQLYARVAKDLLAYLDNKSKTAQEAVDNFITDEQAAFSGDFEPMRKRRLEEGDLKSRPNNELNEDTTSGGNGSIGVQAFPAPDEMEDHILDQRVTDMKSAARDIIARQRENTGSIDIGALYLELAAEYPDVIDQFKPRTQAEVEAALRAASSEADTPKAKVGGAIKPKKAEPAPVQKPAVSKEENERLVALMNQLEANKSQPKAYTSPRDAEELARRLYFAKQVSNGSAEGGQLNLFSADETPNQSRPEREFSYVDDRKEYERLAAGWQELTNENLEEERRDTLATVVKTKTGYVYERPQLGSLPIQEIIPLKNLLQGFRKGEHRSKLYDFVSNMIRDNVGDIDVIVMADDDMNKVEANAQGFYDPVQHHIVLRYGLIDAPNHYFEQTVLHEGVHAVLTSKLSGNKVAQKQIMMLAKHLNDHGVMSGSYMYENVHEFLSEVLARADLQDALRRTKLTKELADIMGIDQWRASNAWQALVQMFAKWLGYVGPYNALEGVLSVTDRIMRDDVTVPGQLATPDFDRTLLDRNSDWSPLGIGFDPRRPTATSYFTKDGLVPSGEFNRQIEQEGAADRFGWNEKRLSIRQGDVTAKVSATTQAAKDQGQAAWNKVKRFATRAATLDQLRQMNRGLFVDKNGVDLMEKLVSAVQRVAPKAQKLREQSDGLAQRFINLKKADSDGADEFATLKEDVNNANVRLGRNLAADANKHLLKGGRNAQGKALLANLQARYNAMSKEWQQLYDDTAAYHRKIQNDQVRGIIDNRLKRYEINPPDRQGFIDRMIEGKPTQADIALFHGKGYAFERLKAVREMRVIQGDYSPAIRHGSFVVNTINNIKDLMGGTEIEPGKVEFRADTDKEARALAEKFAGEVGLPQTNWQKSPLSQANDYGYIVSVQRRGAHFFESEAEAIAWRREHADQYDEISEVAPIKETGQQGGDLTTAQINSLQATIKNSNYSDEEKEDMLDMLQQGSAVLMSGNRIQKRSIARRKVIGASKDFGRNLLQYGEAASSRIAQLEFRPEIDEALEGMREINKDLMDKQQPDRTAVINELTARIDSNVTNVKQPPRWLSDLMSMTFLGRLASPMYSVVNGMQPWMVTYPVLAGRYGPARAAAMLTQAYGSIGFTDQAFAGLKNTYLAGKNFNAAAILDTTDVVGSIREKLKSQSDGAELNKVIDMLLERGGMSEGGFELAQSISQGRGWLGSTLAKADRVARQAPAVVEDINRAVSAIAAYRLARTSGMSDEKARDHAFDVVMNTQGDYSGVNAPRFFNNPVLRPAMQFKKYAQMMTYVLADMTHRAVSKNSSPEERRAAMGQLASVMGVQIAMAGALSLPGIEIAKLGFMVAAALGVGGGWDDQEEKLRQIADETFGKEWGQLLTRGVITRAMNIDVSQRLSLADMMTFGEPRKYDKDGLGSYFWQMAAGAPGGTIEDMRGAMSHMVQGDWSSNDAAIGTMSKAAEKFIPVKVIADAFKAANGYSEGKITTYELGLNIFGVKSARQAEKNRDTGNDRRAHEKIETTHKQLTDQYLHAKTAGDRVKLRAKIIEFNKSAPLRQKVFPNALDKVRQRQEAERVS